MSAAKSSPKKRHPLTRASGRKWATAIRKHEKGPWTAKGMKAVDAIVWGALDVLCESMSEVMKASKQVSITVDTVETAAKLCGMGGAKCVPEKTASGKSKKITESARENTVFRCATVKHVVKEMMAGKPRMGDHAALCVAYKLDHVVTEVVKCVQLCRKADVHLRGKSSGKPLHKQVTTGDVGKAVQMFATGAKTAPYNNMGTVAGGGSSARRGDTDHKL